MAVIIVAALAVALLTPLRGRPTLVTRCSPACASEGLSENNRRQVLKKRAVQQLEAGCVQTTPSESRSSTQSSQARRAARKRNAQEDLERELEARYAKAQAHTVPRLLRASKAGGRSCFVKLNNDTEHRLERRRYDSPAGRWTPECEPPETIYKGERDVPFGTESSGFMSGTSGMVVYGLQHERFGNLRCAPWRSSSFETSYL